MMTVDHSIDYSYAGKGAKRRQRLQPADTPERRAKPKTYRQEPELENRKVKHVERSGGHYNAMGVKARIRLLVIDRDASVDTIVDTLNREECPVSKVTIGNLRRDMIEVMKLLDKEGLLNIHALARRRRKIKARDRDD
jgi:hypothetical protein